MYFLINLIAQIAIGEIIMARRRVARTRMPLEWAFGNVTAMAVSGTVYTGEIDLDLLPDEIAEIYKIDSTVELESSGSPEKADSVNFCMGVLNMNPDYNPVAGDMVKGGNAELDLETFFSHVVTVSTILTTSGAGKSPVSHTKISDFSDYPLLVGTNVGMAAIGSFVTDVDADFWVRLYFKRRKATATELNQILLKRR